MVLGVLLNGKLHTEHSEYEVLSRSIQPTEVSSSVAVEFKLNAEK
jgi:hypothetical protein